MAISGSDSALNRRSLRSSSTAPSPLADTNCSSTATDNTSREAQRRNDWMLSFCGSPRSRSRASRNQNQPP